MHRHLLAFFMGLVIATPAWPQDAGRQSSVKQQLREPCFDSPGLGIPACTLDPGHVAIEIEGIDWTREHDGVTRTDTLLGGATVVRLGVDYRTEAQIGWAGFGQMQEKDLSAGRLERSTGGGDVTLAMRRNLRNPDGSGFAVALMPYATLPAGGHAIGAGDWGTGIIAPLTYDLGDVTLELTPQIDAAVDEDGDGRHLGFGSVTGLAFDVSKGVSINTELSVYRDRDPAGASTRTLAGFSALWQPDNDLQFDAGLNIGLNHASPDCQLYVGIARRF